MNRVRVLRLSCPGKVKKHPTANPSDSCQIFSKRFIYHNSQSLWLKKYIFRRVNYSQL